MSPRSHAMGLGHGVCVWCVGGSVGGVCVCVCGVSVCVWVGACVRVHWCRVHFMSVRECHALQDVHRVTLPTPHSPMIFIERNVKINQ